MLNEIAGFDCGLDRFEARKKLWADLEETGLAVKKEPRFLSSQITAWWRSVLLSLSIQPQCLKLGMLLLF
ncbi:Valine--tRNA ligase [Actinidia chinensis var. chinensis]|uniref:Valine--tRNA ligase n=1 Tax=Actinidia chinensis var. chinensis TaxID=1590841 RepID=A0A2R6R346_ACTCC|nr:Valine--tRNA ligase [Actinidia chinensis var. chinensis]